MKALIIVIFSFFTVTQSFAATSNNQGNVNSQELKEDYRAFLQQLKQLNSQYKQITGEISKVMKEEGVPQWEEGQAAKDIDQLFPKEPTVLNPEMGVTIRETAQEMNVDIELPGIKKETLKVSIKDSQNLTVSAQKKDDTAVKTVQKTVKLPAAVDPSGSKAGYVDGVLTLKLRKIAAQEVQIPVR